MLNRTAASAFIMAFLITPIGAVSTDFAQANPYHREADWTEVPPPAGTQAPIIAIHAPQNGSYYPKNLNLTLDVIIPKTNGDISVDYGVSELYYVGSWKPNEITYIAKNFGENTSFSINLAAIPGGNLSVTLYAVGVGYYVTSEEFDAETYTMITHFATFEMNSYSTVSFIKDLVPPRVTVQSPQNTTYNSSEVKLDFTVNEEVSQIHFSLDGKVNQTFTGNNDLTGLTNGEHNVVLYVADLAGNEVSSKTVFFSVNVPEPFPVVPAIAVSVTSIVAVVGLGLLVYLKKRLGD
jgi:hypothetical protein